MPIRDKRTVKPIIAFFEDDSYQTPKSRRSQYERFQHERSKVVIETMIKMKMSSPERLNLCTWHSCDRDFRQGYKGAQPVLRVSSIKNMYGWSVSHFDDFLCWDPGAPCFDPYICGSHSNDICESQSIELGQVKSMLCVAFGIQLLMPIL